MSTQTIKRTTAKRTVVVGGVAYVIAAEWKGGPYIDLSWPLTGGPAFEVINVWDYKTGKLKADLNVSRELTEWVKENRSEIPNYHYHTA